MPGPIDSSDLGRLGDDLRQEMSATAAGLRQEIHTTGEQIRADLRQEIHASGEQIRAELRQEIRISAGDVRAHVAQVAADLRQEMREGTAAILERLDASAAETRRYMGVVAEDLKSDIKAVAEGLGALDEKVERFRGEVHDEFAKVDRRMLHLEVRVIGRSDRA